MKNLYLVTNTRSGFDLGAYRGDDGDDAIRAMLVDSGNAGVDWDADEITATEIELVCGDENEGIGTHDGRPVELWKGGVSLRREDAEWKNPDGELYLVEREEWVKQS